MSGWALAIFLLGGGAGLWRDRPELVAWGRGAWRDHPALLALGLLCALWLANRSTGPLGSYDSGMYELPLVVWAKAYAIVPGLANLHGRFGFNNARVLVAAMLDQGFWSGRVEHLLSGVFLLPWVGQIVLRAGQLAGRTEVARSACVFDLMLLAPTLAFVLSPNAISSPTAGVPASVLFFAGTSALYRAMVAPAGVDGSGGGRGLAVAMIALVAAACVKLMTAGLGGSSGCSPGRGSRGSTVARDPPATDSASRSPSPSASLSGGSRAACC